VGCATQIFYPAFDRTFFALPKQIKTRIQSAIDDIAMRLATFPHHRLTGSDRFRLRVGDYRVIYKFTAGEG
jgi:mRNA-degrading endonuclease RelE of RelBE toxin-antitoxin system